jgi:hypothetical protein
MSADDREPEPRRVEATADDVVSSRPQAKDIPDQRILALLHPTTWTTWWVLADEHFPEFPPKVVLAKLRQLYKRGLIDGCPCGCRGDWVLQPGVPGAGARGVGPNIARAAVLT